MRVPLDMKDVSYDDSVDDKTVDQSKAEFIKKEKREEVKIIEEIDVFKNKSGSSFYSNQIENDNQLINEAYHINNKHDKN